MIGPGWAGDERARPRANGDTKRRIAIVTGTRAEYGLLKPVMYAVRERADLELLVIAAGSHLVQPARTYYEIKQEFDVVDSIPMQTVGRVGRWHDVESTGKGISRFARSFERLRPDVVVVLGDRIEAFAAASAASIGGLPVAHLHGGDLAEGVADEAMRHAITKLAHIHFPATETSAARILRMGEPKNRVHVVGSPAIDGLNGIDAMSDERAQELGDPKAVLLMHPIGRPDEQEEAVASSALEAIGERPTLCLMPNLDPGRVGIVRAIESASEQSHVTVCEHLKREEFVGLLKRLAHNGGFLIGNSSAGLIEAGAVGAATVNIGSRQSGRERGTNVIDAHGETTGAIAGAIGRVVEMDRSSITHPFGDGRTGVRVAEILAGVNLAEPGLLRKHFV
ncbi:MAG: UDP-N-acetylglucosamine 2-epimerase (hydrolyzing) [Phycisphaerales bacterium]|nr:UDP-N-acetylglucosamine 2-epimerase (hydrolyzing) [Phycisphaerales bacterium]